MVVYQAQCLSSNGSSPWLKPAMSPATELYPITVRRASSLCMFAE